MQLVRSPTSPPGILSWADAVPDRAALCAVFLCLAAIACLDFVSGESPVQHLYYVPIVFAAVRFSARFALFVTAAAVVLYHLANPPAPSMGYRQADLLQSAVFFACCLCSRKLARDARRLAKLARTDDLTGLLNLRGFEEGLRLMLASAIENGGPVTLVVVDADRLKSVNDTLGHLAGADAVCLIGAAIARVFPSPAIACRYGGDEFAIALPCGLEAARTRARELRGAVQACTPRLAGHSLPAGSLSVSIGIASRLFDASPGPDPVRAGASLFRAADSALYLAKRQGRNRLATAEEDS